MKRMLSAPNTIHSYETALQFLHGLDISVMKLGLDRMRAVLKTLGDPQDQLPMVHVAGTNGKGSVTAMLSSILKASGYKVGTFTSPHLVHVRERVVINGNPILSDDFQYEVNALKAHLEQHQFPREDWPTFFEFLNVLAYRYFQRKNVDITVFETGLGGRLDSTNVVKHPNLTVITGIGLDHMDRLGASLSAIAAEKAGIAKNGSPLVVGPNIPDEAFEVIQAKAEHSEIPLVPADSASFKILPDSEAGKGLHVRTAEQDYWLSLLAPYQKDNLATVLACVQQLRQQGFNIQESHVKKGLQSVEWPVRFQYLEQHAVVLDGSHNEDGFNSLVESLNLYFPERSLFWLLSLRNNRAPEMLVRLIKAFPQTKGIVLTRTEPQRSYHAPEDLKRLLGQATDVPVLVTQTPDEAWHALKQWMMEQEACSPLGVATGSLYTAGALLTLV